MRTRTSWLILPLLWLATALRFFRLGAQSFWNDEGNSARLAERSLSLIVEGAAADVHPPLYYLLLAAWRQLLGQSEFALRALSAFAGLLLVAAVLALARRSYRRAGSRPVPLQGGLRPALPAVLVAIHPVLVYYSQEARMYALLGLWAVLGTLLFLRLLPLLGRPATGTLYKVAAGYLIVALAGLYTHYFFPAVLLVHNLLIAYVLLRRIRRQTADRTLPATGNTPHTTNHNLQSSLLDPFTRSPIHPFLARWSALMIAAFLLYLPWLPIFLRQTGGRGADPIPVTTFLAGAARWLTLGETTAAQGLWVWLPVAALFLLAIAALFPSRGAENAGGEEGREQSKLALNLQSPISNLRSLTFGLHILLPPLLILLLGATRPAYYKFMIVVPPFLALLAARGAWQLWSAARILARRRLTLPPVFLGGASLLLVAVIAWGNIQSLRNLYFNPAFARADYRGIAARIASEGHPNAAIILNAANQWEVFTYYHRDGAPVYPLPRGQPDARRIAAELAAIAAQHDRLYALFWGEDERDPQRLVERWLDANAFKAREQWVGDVRFVTYAAPSGPVGVMETSVGARFGQHITLEGYTLRGAEGASGPARRVQAIGGDILQVTLFWHTAQAVDTRYKIFLHLTDEQGLLRAQRDAEPLGNLAPTTTWEPRQTIVDHHGLFLPADLPPGDYRLALGLYPLDDPQARLPIRWSEDGVTQTADSYPLATVTVR